MAGFYHIKSITASSEIINQYNQKKKKEREKKRILNLNSLSQKRF